MKWKANARKRPNTGHSFRDRMNGAVLALVTSPIRMSHGKPVVLWTHTRDFVDEDETGRKSVVASITFRQGTTFSPRPIFTRASESWVSRKTLDSQIVDG